MLRHQSVRSETIRCISCKKEFRAYDAGTCNQCYEEARETEEELRREIEDLKARVAFLRFWSPVDHANRGSTSPAILFPDVVLVASDDGSPGLPPDPVPAHKVVLASRSPVFKAMLENEMEESSSGTVKISDISYNALLAFVNYLYTAEAWLDERMTSDLLVLAEKYQVKHLKAYCEKFLVSKLKRENRTMNYASAHQHDAKLVFDASLTDDMDKLTKSEEYMELVQKAQPLVEIYEAYFPKHINTAAHKDT